MITCVLGLTACGSSDEISEFQQSKLDQAEYLSTYVIDMMETIAESGSADEVLNNYNNIELADWFEYNFNSYTGTSFECEGKGIRTAVTSFEDGLEDIGQIINYGDATVTYDDDDITVIVPVTGVNGEAEVELIFANDIYYTLSSCSLNVDESFGSLMARAALNTLIGMGTVFIVLILISFLISLFKYIPAIQNAFKKKDNTTQANVQVAAPVVEATTEELSDDTELVAVIAAAIAAYEGTSADGFQVRSIKRANTKNWKKQ